MQRLVEFSPYFDALYRNFPAKIRIASTISPSTSNSTVLLIFLEKLVRRGRFLAQTPSHYEKVQFARAHRLWHYHIGIPDYKPSRYGDYHTSDWVVHFQRDRHDTVIRLVDYGFHDPMHMPKLEYL